MDDLDYLEAESLHILAETLGRCTRPVLLYSIGKDSAVLHHLLKKLHAGEKISIPFVHIDTGWKFSAMLAFRDRLAHSGEVRMIVEKNSDPEAASIDPFNDDAQLHTLLRKTIPLKRTLKRLKVDAALGGARRDEEESRAKERIVSWRDAHQQWLPKQQRPELWRIYNTLLCEGESLRVFPLSNWTELDVWRYIRRESIPVVDLYFAKPRPVFRFQGRWVLADDERCGSLAEATIYKNVRFRSLGCYPFTGAIESKAATLDAIIEELALSNSAERGGRSIDGVGSASMESKKRHGYF